MAPVHLANQKLKCLLVAKRESRYLLFTFPGCGFKGDKVELIRKNGSLVLVKNGTKQFCVEENKLSICPASQQQEVQT